ncbi:hypothetical protein LY76DRAFT_396696 [Colletotrichum caudatum]|nr:hypothetical protein LY76DRAFT_396696 [Colletotrichum caudatum]
MGFVVGGMAIGLQFLCEPFFIFIFFPEAFCLFLQRSATCHQRLLQSSENIIAVRSQSFVRIYYSRNTMVETTRGEYKLDDD